MGATKDPLGANLDRVQIVKGWRDGDGGLHEQVFDVALSDGRNIREDGTVAAVGSTVDVASASYTNTIGDTDLAVVWRTRTSTRKHTRFYYVRSWRSRRPGGLPTMPASST